MAKAAKKVEVKKEEVQPMEGVQQITEVPSVLDTIVKLNSETNKSLTNRASSSQETIDVPSEPTQDGIQIEATIEDIKPATLTGKTVPLSISGKVRLLNTKTNRIITGLIDQKLAQAQVNQYPQHIQIVNESEYVNKNK